MSYLIDVLGTKSSPEATESALAQYKAYLDAVRELLPPAAYEFASTPWHYDYRDHRCPHDRDKNPAFWSIPRRLSQANLS